MIYGKKSFSKLRAYVKEKNEEGYKECQKFWMKHYGKGKMTESIYMTPCGSIHSIDFHYDLHLILLSIRQKY